jgi:flagellin
MFISESIEESAIAPGVPTSADACCTENPAVTLFPAVITPEAAVPEAIASMSAPSKAVCISTKATASSATAAADKVISTVLVPNVIVVAAVADDAVALVEIQTALDGADIDAIASGTAASGVITAGNKVTAGFSVQQASADVGTPGAIADSSMLSDINIESSTSATDALATITAAIEQVAGHRASYGALQNRLEYTVSNLMNVAEFTTAARSRIEDADFASESAKLAKAQVLQQTGTAMLAQANASSQLALQLIR